MNLEPNKVPIFLEFYIFSLTNGFVKKSMKTPRNAIELALKYKQDYIERYT